MVVTAKKVLYCITKSNWGGAQRYVYDLAVAAQQRGFNVAVALGGDGLLAQKLHGSGIMIYHNKFLGRDVSLGKDIESFFEFYRLFKKEKPDVLHLNSSKAGALGALAARLTGVKKIIYTSHGWAFRERRPAPARATIWLVSWLTALLCSDIICVSDSELRATQGMPFCAKKAVRIYNGIDLDMHFGSGDVIRAAFPAGVKIVGTIGELTKNKNQIALVEQAKNDPSLYVAIVGEGEDRTMLEQKIKEYGLESRVKLFGFMPAVEVLKGFDVFALPSIKEGLSYVVLEARAAGLPIVANRVGGVGEALDTDLNEFSLNRMVEQTVAVYNT